MTVDKKLPTQLVALGHQLGQKKLGWVRQWICRTVHQNLPGLGFLNHEPQTLDNTPSIHEISLLSFYLLNFIGLFFSNNEPSPPFSFSLIF
jgi:hypothetical protein